MLTTASKGEKVIPTVNSMSARKEGRNIPKGIPIKSSSMKLNFPVLFKSARETKYPGTRIERKIRKDLITISNIVIVIIFFT
jgi:hypothetical protein